jgi:2-dehydropantoate 2-reductase
VSGPIVVWGAGAIGGTIGAYLARAGHRIVFVDSEVAHVEAMRHHGLRIEGPIENFGVPAEAVLPHQLVGRYEQIFLCVKAHHTETAARQLAPHLAESGYVASFQNGLNELVLADIVGRSKTIGAFVNFGADYMEPGLINYGGRGAFVVGELDGQATPRLDALLRLVQTFEPEAIASDNIMGFLWGKLGYGALLFATALTNASICDALAAEAPRPLYRRIAGEAVAVAHGLGIAPIGFNGYRPEAFEAGATDAAAAASFAAMVAHNAKSAKTHSGIWRDLAIRKRPTEVEAQLGPIVHFARQANRDAPAIAQLIAMIHEIEDGKRSLAWDNLAELESRAGAMRPQDGNLI